MVERKARGKLLKILRERRLYKTAGRRVSPTGSELLMVMVCLIMVTIVLTWASSLKPSDLPQQTTVNLVRLDRHTAACTIHTILPPDARIDFLTYTNATGTFNLNQMVDETEPIHDVGESGIIYVCDYNEHVKVVAVFSGDDGSSKNQTVFDRVI